MSAQSTVRRCLILCDMRQSVNEQTARSRICLKQNWSYISIDGSGKPERSQHLLPRGLWVNIDNESDQVS